MATPWVKDQYENISLKGFNNPLGEIKTSFSPTG